VRLTMLAGDKRRIIVVLRWVMAIALSYLVLFSARDPAGWRSGLCIALLLASNLVLMRLPEATFHHPAFDPVLVAADTALITAALWICGSAGPDFFFVFFFVVFLAALGGRLELTALGAALAAVAYLSVLPAGVAWTSAALLRVPFFFVTALSYGYLASGAREAESRARAAEEVVALKTAFLGTVSHEMRSPLSVILGLLTCSGMASSERSRRRTRTRSARSTPTPSSSSRSSIARSMLRGSNRARCRSTSRSSTSGSFSTRFAWRSRPTRRPQSASSSRPTRASHPS